MGKRPAFQFYPSDWRNDPGLRLCSSGARGMWIDMLCLMHEGEPYGFLTVQGRPIDAQMLARLIGESAASARKWLKELADNDVFSVDDHGTIFSRRMVRDEDIRERRAAGGAAGAAYGSKGAQHGSKGGRPRTQKTPDETNGRGEEKPPLKPPPSSSSSSSSSSSASPCLPPDVQAVLDAGGYVSPPGDLTLLREWISAGADLDQDIVPVVRREAERLKGRTGQAPRTLKIFDGAVREKLVADAAEIERLERVATRIQAMDQAQAAGGAH